MGDTIARLDCGTAIARCATGDRTALRDLYDSEAGAMLRFAMSILRQRELAEEALQDSFALIWRNAPKFDASLGVGRGWMYTILRHRGIDLMRRAKLEPEITDNVLLKQVDERPGPEALLILKDEMRQLQLCLDRLRPAYRECLVLSHVSGLTSVEVALILSVPVNTVKTWTRRASREVRTCMNPDDGSNHV